MIYKSDEYRLKLLKINSRYIMDQRLENNLNLIEMTLSDFFSFDASDRYRFITNN